MTGSVADVTETADSRSSAPPPRRLRLPVPSTRRERRESRPDYREPPGILEPTFSGVGLVVGAFFIAVSLEPSLLPRTPVVQGLASGVSFMAGYVLGASGHAVWNYLQVPNLQGLARRVVAWSLLAVIGVILSLSIWRWVGWQNDIRQLFGMEHLTPTAWPIVLGVGVAVAAVVLVIGRLLRRLFRWAGDTLDRWLPRRLAVTLAAGGLGLAIWLLTSGLLVQAFFTVSNEAFSVRNAGDLPDTELTESELRSGGPGSLIPWDELGRQGRHFVSSAPTVDELNSFSGGGALEPVRVYVGLGSADTVEERSRLMLDELIRTGAFDREVLVLGTVTGTGYLQPNAVDSLEFLFNGDTAIAGLQYTYLPSWISLLADQESVQETAQVSFRIVHDYWAELPADSRPELYLYGLSLGAMGVEAVLSNIDILNEPIDGALMVGPPYVNRLHDELTRDRDAGSPVWAPVVSDGRTVRFTGEEDILDEPSAPWDGVRVVYLQHGSDPVAFFNPTLFIREPEWLEGSARAPDVSMEMSWFPLVTGWQTVLDLPAAGSVPWGYGHMYSITANLQAWVGVTDPAGWTDADTAELAVLLEERLAEHEKQLILIGD